MKVNREIKVPLYVQVYERLLKMITEKNWQAEELLPSERELSTMFNVDRLTVRKALAMLAKEGLVEKIAGLGTRVTNVTHNQNDNSNFRNLLFLLPRVTNSIVSAQLITESFITNLFYSVEKECKNHGFNLVYTTISDSELLADVLKDRAIKGILFVSKVNEKFITDARKLKIPAVVVNNESNSFPTIRADREKGTYEAIKHLIELNHRQICFISGIPNYVTSKDSFHGYQRALMDANIDLKQQIIKEGDWTFEGGFKAMEEILKEQSPLPTAVFACNDMTAIGAMEALKTAGLRVPQDISVIGFDNIQQSKYCSPKLTTVEVNTSLMAKIACEHLFMSLKNYEIHNIQIILPTELILRESTA
ncbi:MAG: GntR family transcriptional regulator, partial [Bacteroidota bacterium]